MPAAFTWTGALSTDATVAANWSSLEEPGGLPGEDDHLYFDATHTIGIPGSPPSPGGGLSVNCDNLQSLGSGFAGVHISAAYTGTVTMGEALTFGVFDLANGAISQSAAAHDLTVNGTFNWTGGVLNSSTTAATFTLSGATAAISPGANNTVVTGSTVNLVASSGIGAYATFNSGTVQFAGGLGLVIDALCRADMKPLPNAKVLHEGTDLESTPKTILVKAGASMFVATPPNTTAEWDAWGMKLENTGGEVGFGTGVIVNVGLKVAQAQPTAFIKQTAGKLTIEAGASVSARPTLNGFTEITGGTLLINDPLTGIAQPAQLIGNLTFAGGSLHFEGRYTEFKVAGDVTWTGGIFGPRLDVSDEAKLDVWNIVGKLIFPANSTGVVAAATAGYDPEQGVNANKRWQVLKFDTVQLPPDNSKPPVVTVPGNAPLQWYIFNLPNGKTEWKLGAQSCSVRAHSPQLLHWSRTYR